MSGSGRPTVRRPARDSVLLCSRRVYVATSGNRTVRTLSRLALDPPYIEAWCHLRDASAFSPSPASTAS
jgi:hypothetical protein